MENKLFSPVLLAANNIVKTKRPLNRTSRDYNDFVNWLDTSNKELKKVKLPTKKKVEALATSLSFDIAASDGGGGIDLLGSLLGGAGALGAGLGLRGLFKGKKVNKLPKEKINEIEEFPKEKIGKIKGLPEEKPIRKFGKIGGILNVGLAVWDYAGRKSEGQSNLQAGVGAAGGALGGMAGAEAGAAAGAAIGALFGGVGAVPGAIIGGLIGGFGGGQLGGNIADKLTGADKIDERLKAQEKKQKEAASRRVTFPDVINKFDKVVSKFEKFVGGMGAAIAGKQPSNVSTKDKMTEYGEYGNRDQTPSPTPGQLQDLEATGGALPSSSSKGDKFGYSSWRGRNHNGIDYPLPEGTPISVIQPGTVADAGFRDNGYGNQVKVNHPGGVSSFYAHLSSINVASGQKIDPGTVIGKIGTTGHSTGPHLHFEVDVNGKVSNPEPYEDQLFRFGGNVKVREKKGQQNNKVNTITKQQSIEEFIKGTKSGDKILKDPKLKAQLLGEKYQFKNAMVKTPVTDPEVKQAQQMYNAYVRDIRSRQKAKVIPSATPPAIPQALMEDTSATGNTTMIMQQPSATSAGGAGQARMIPVPMGGGGGGGSVISGPSEGQIVNSLLKAFLLTNLSGT